ncbi:hypothetical protein LPUS_11414 [Lasallia pustulata]|uniref:Uncharacterized protein n=1 Tax=Lasallia pustulata TaxID=136370 RepID=A0A1W5DBS4_9LECA|nr:hypothetical protein LPUS_11414 [Lasallia pustulata]
MPEPRDPLLKVFTIVWDSDDTGKMGFCGPLTGACLLTPAVGASNGPARATEGGDSQQPSVRFREEKKRRKRGKRLNLLGEEESGPQFFSPGRVTAARTWQAEKEEEEQQHRQDIESRKALVAFKKLQKEEEKLQKAAAAVERQPLALSTSGPSQSATSKPVKLASEEELPELRESIIALGHQFHWFVISGIPNAKILKETNHLCIKIIYQYYSYDPPSEPTGRSRSSTRNYQEGLVIPISSTGSSVVETLGPKFPTVWSIDRTKGSPLHTALNHFKTDTTLLKETPHFLNYHKVPALSIPQTSPETDAPTTEPSQSSTASPLEKEPCPVTDSTSVETHQLIVNLPTKEASALEEAIRLAGIEEETLEEERETTQDGKQRTTSHNKLSTEEVSGSHTIEERELLIQEASLAQEKADIKVRLLRKARDEYNRKEFARGLSGKCNQLAVEWNLEKEQCLLERQRLEQAGVKQDRLEQERLDQRAEGSLQEQPHFNMSNQEGSSNPRSSGLPLSSNHPFSGNAFSAEQI